MTELPGTGVDDKLTTDPPLPPGTPDVDELVGDPVPTGEEQSRPGDVTDEDTTAGDDHGGGGGRTAEPPD